MVEEKQGEVGGSKSWITLPHMSHSVLSQNLLAITVPTHSPFTHLSFPFHQSTLTCLSFLIFTPPLTQFSLMIVKVPRLSLDIFT